MLPGLYRPQGFWGYTVFDLAGGYDLGQVGFASKLDSSVLAPSDPAGKLYVFHASAPRQVFGTIDIRF